MAGGDDDYFSVVDAAFERSELPRAPASQESPLGCSPWDLYIFRLLQLAGIVVEMVGRPALEGEEPPRLHESMQIVPTCIMQDTLGNRNKDEIKLCNQLQAEGVVVKLNTAYKWKVTVLDEIQEPKKTRQPKRGREDDAGKIIYSNHTYEIVFDSNRGKEEHKQNLRATFAVGNCLTIYLAFDTNTERGDETGDTLCKDGWPVIKQRRVDLVFTNCCLVTTQVRSVFCVLCSASKLRCGTQHVCRSRYTATTEST